MMVHRFGGVFFLQRDGIVQRSSISLAVLMCRNKCNRVPYFFAIATARLEASITCFNWPDFRNEIYRNVIPIYSFWICKIVAMMWHFRVVANLVLCILWRFLLEIQYRLRPYFRWKNPEFSIHITFSNATLEYFHPSCYRCSTERRNNC